MALGDLINKYETGGVGTSSISNTRGDHGGASYGTFQFSHTTGSLGEFVNHLRDTMPEAYKILYPLLGSAGAGKNGAFGKAWIGLSKNPAFQKVERNYGYSRYINEVLPRITDADVRNRFNSNEVLKDVLLSTATQHGQYGAPKIINRVLNNSMSDSDMVRAIYKDRGKTDANGTLLWFKSSSPNVQKAVADRFRREEQDALNALAALNTQNVPNAQATLGGQQEEIPPFSKA